MALLACRRRSSIPVPHSEKTTHHTRLNACHQTHRKCASMACLQLQCRCSAPPPSGLCCVCVSFRRPADFANVLRTIARLESYPGCPCGCAAPIRAISRVTSARQATVSVNSQGPHCLPIVHSRTSSDRSIWSP